MKRTGTKTDASQRFDDFPGEHPSQGEVERWMRGARSKLNDEQKSVMRDAVPADLMAKTAPFDLSTLPPLGASATDAVQATRAVAVANYNADNARKTAHRDARIIEIKQTLGDELGTALENSSLLLLKKIRVGAEIGDPANECFDGCKMFRKIAALTSSSMTVLSNDTADDEYDAFRQQPLHDGSSADMVAQRINRMVRDVNPYMTEPKSDKGLSKWIVDQMPPSCFTMVDSAMRDLERSGDHEKPEAVAAQMLIVAQKTQRNLGKQMAHAAMGAGMLCGGCCPSEAASRAMATTPGGGWGYNAVSGAPLGMGGQKPLPQGQLCKEGTCPFAHQGSCWSNANFNGDITQRAWDDKPALARCEARRQAHARQIGVAYKPLRAPKKKAPDKRGKKPGGGTPVKSALDEAALQAGDPFVGVGFGYNDNEGDEGFDYGYDGYNDLDQEAAMIAESEDLDVSPKPAVQPRAALAQGSAWPAAHSEATDHARGGSAAPNFPVAGGPSPQATGGAGAPASPNNGDDAPAPRPASRADMLCGGLVLMTLLGAVAVAFCAVTVSGDAQTVALLVAGGASTVAPRVTINSWAAALGAQSHSLAANVADAVEVRPMASFIFTLIAMWALADFSVGAAAASAWRGIESMARLTTRPTARASAGRVVRCFAYMIIALGVFTLVQSVPRAGASEPPRNAVLAARRLIGAIEEPGGIVAQAFEARLDSSYDTHYLDGSLEGGRGSFLSRGEADEIAQTFNVSIKGGDNSLPKDFCPSEGSGASSKLRGIAVASKVGDTGAKVVIFTPKTAREHGIKGTLELNAMKLSTANGTIKPKYSIEADIPVLMVTPLKTKRTARIRMRGIVVPECAHDLIPIAAMAKTHGLALQIAPWTGEASLLVFNKRIGPLGSVLPLMNMGVLVFPPPPESEIEHNNTTPASAATTTDMPVTRGHAGATAKTTERTHHCRCIHRGEYVTRNLHRCVADVPKELCDRVGRKTIPCDGCLLGSMKNHPSPPDSRRPEATHAGQWISGDVYTVQVGYRWGGQRKIFQLYDHYSHRNFPFLIRTESECPQKLREFFAQCRVDNVKVSSLNLDNAKIFVNEGVLFETCRKVCQETLFDGIPVRVTSCCPYTPRQNGTIEHQFDVCGTDVRRCMSDAHAPANLFWDAWQHCCYVQARLPLKGSPDECGMLRWSGTKPHFAQVVRVWACVGVVKDFQAASKMHPQGIVCMHLGRCTSQPGWRMLDLSTGRIYDTCHVDFVEDCLPGVTLDRHGREQMVPTYSRDYDPKAPYAPWQVPSKAPNDPTIGASAEQGGQPLGSGASAPKAKASGGSSSSNDGGGVADPMSQRLSRPGRADASGKGKYVDSFSVTAPDGEYFIYLGSGELRDGDLKSQLMKSGYGCLCVDVCIDARAHNLLDDGVTSRLVELASSPQCVGVMASLPCSTWCAARYEPGGPPVRRDSSEPAGITDEHGRLPHEILRANRLVENGLKVMTAARQQRPPRRCLLECPAWRGEGSPTPLLGREKHVSMISYPPLLRWATEQGARVVVFEQCQTGLEAQKSTQLLATPEILASVQREFAHLRCRDSVCSRTGRPHKSHLGSTRELQQYTPEMNRRLAQALVETLIKPAADSPGDGGDDGGGSADDSSDGGGGGGGDDGDDDAGGDDPHATPARGARRATPQQPARRSERIARSSVLSSWAAFFAGTTTAPCPTCDGACAKRLMRSDAFASVEDARVRTPRETLPPKPARGGDEFCGEIDDLFGEFYVEEPTQGGNGTKGGGQPHVECYFDRFFAPAFAAKSKGGDSLGYREAMRLYPERCEAACEKELATLRGFNAFQEVPEDTVPGWQAHYRRSWDPRSKELGQCPDVTGAVWALRNKTDENGDVYELKARCAYNGAERQRRLKRQDERRGSGTSSTKLETFSPATRSSTYCLCVAVGKARGRRHGCFDVTGAYLQGTPRESEVVYVRPPPGYRTFDERGVPIVWRMAVPLYGQEDAGLIWYRTITEQLVQVQGFKQSSADPCYFYKIFANGARLDLVLYVDDGWYFSDADCVYAAAEIDALSKRFKLKVKLEPKQFLGLNVDAPDGPDGEVIISVRAYLEKIGEELLPKPISEYPKLLTPCRPQLLEAYEKAKELKATPSPEALKRYQTKLGKALYASAAGARPDLAYAVGVCARCATYPSEDMEKCLDYAIVYAVQTAHDGLRFGRDEGATLHASSDSDWHVSHSTSAYVIMYGAACVCYASKRQQCIAMSSTEAEIIAASQAALEIVYLRALLREMGADVDEPTSLLVDNSGAVELSKHQKACHRSRHVKRRYLKVRELVAEGEVIVQWVASKENPSDLLSKGTIESTQFNELKRKIMSGIGGAGGAAPPAMAAAPVAIGRARRVRDQGSPRQSSCRRGPMS